MATLIRATGEQMTVKPASGGKFTLEELQGFVSGFIERIDLENGKAMYINEDGKALQMKRNVAATVCLQQRGCLQGDYIAGDAVQRRIDVWLIYILPKRNMMHYLFARRRLHHVLKEEQKMNT